MSKPVFKPLLLGLGLAAAASGGASAETFRAATWNAANSPNTRFLNDVAELVAEASGGEMEFEVYSGGSLLPPDGTLPGLESGVAQLANITAAYIPSDMPINNILADLSFMADDQLALAFAATEANFFDPMLRGELDDKNIVFATGFTIGIYNLICGFEADSIDDFQGRKIRTSSSAQIAFTEEIGGVSVSVPGTEIYTGIQRGSLDCAMGTPLFLTDFFKLNEVAKSVYLMPFGSNANGGYYFNKDFWQDRTPEERRILLNALSRATARSMIDWAADIEAAIEAAREAGVALNEPEETGMEQLNDFKARFLEDLPQSSMDKRGVEDPTEMIANVTALIDKWKGLLAEVDTSDLDAVTALLDREIFDKVDVETYGME
ncbi:C4-dicarboxylate TRAP transporter substrate-binding protein [Celeribacter indicus]|uniref:TRAP dicarboxylate transporter-DctP subunit n=1 Tax=Celeribacter indicus TaxID=1208324 RepID=A0A0B5E0Q5_9RHOB|nr:C4-dicarboxylate TRAP transporter substrate-binding protein [Celeribacter indicus]AJE49218.1 TRAP dicarboxylate transporter- DctP subunit [Celeribacter indicus]SDX51851.1 TRAP-type C4-dicarboxylate transport system, substrate-binding protein [Celeribacter indicus]